MNFYNNIRKVKEIQEGMELHTALQFLVNAGDINMLRKI
jgi:hypothetical protein